MAIVSRAKGEANWDKRTLFMFGACACSILLLVAVFDKTPTRTSWHIYNCVLALAAGGIASLLPGTLSLNWHPGIRATGALALAVLVFYFGKDMAPAPPQMQNMRSYLAFPHAECDPRNCDVYVVFNAKIVKMDVVSSPEPPFGVVDQELANQIQIVRGPGGVRIDFASLRQGDELYIMVQENALWWVSSDITVPDAQLEMKATSVTNLKNRIKSGH